MLPITADSVKQPDGGSEFGPDKSADEDGSGGVATAKTDSDEPSAAGPGDSATPSDAAVGTTATGPEATAGEQRKRLIFYQTF